MILTAALSSTAVSAGFIIPSSSIVPIVGTQNTSQVAQWSVCNGSGCCGIQGFCHPRLNLILQDRHARPKALPMIKIVIVNPK